MSSLFDEWIKSKSSCECISCGLDIDDVSILCKNLKGLLHPGSIENISCIEEYIKEKVETIKLSLSRLLSSVEKLEDIKLNKEDIINKFLDSLPEVQSYLDTDIEAIFVGDPASSSKNEIVLCYPGFRAILIYRISHVLYELNVPILPRVISEYAHSKTGIDINPGAKIGKYFCIDHGTGIVIGETCEIGEHVKIYQGVTLGALSLRDGRLLSNTKRHPTIEDNVTIYSGASIFGGDTIIGKGVTIGSSAFITTSVESGNLATVEGIVKRNKK